MLGVMRNIEEQLVNCIERSSKEMAGDNSSQVRDVNVLVMGGCERNKFEDGEPKY